MSTFGRYWPRTVRPWLDLEAAMAGYAADAISEDVARTDALLGSDTGET